ncbi:MAG: hypothetical protein LRY76_06760 [Alphaproteobacteria bacterium]|nr:hypothetical protein [Alphaproteobacteria bacterium]
MRSFIAIAAICVALSGGSVLADCTPTEHQSKLAPPFAEDGVYVPAGDTIEIAIAGKCRRFTNHDRQVGFFFSPSDPAQWPDKRDETRAPMEPLVTEEPCK